jgi:hypothetical protein
MLTYAFRLVTKIVQRHSHLRYCRFNVPQPSRVLYLVLVHLEIKLDNSAIPILHHPLEAVRLGAFHNYRLLWNVVVAERRQNLMPWPWLAQRL